MKSKKCLWCKRSFKPYNEHQLYCSTACAEERKKSGKRFKTCYYCKKIFELKPNESFAIQFCSNECKESQHIRYINNSRRGRLKACTSCGKEFIINKNADKICSACREVYNQDGKIISARLRFEVFKRDNFTCQYCGRNVKDDKIKLHCDHVLPFSKGGLTTLENLTTSCSDCNLGKSNILL